MPRGRKPGSHVKDWEAKARETKDRLDGLTDEEEAWLREKLEDEGRGTFRVEEREHADGTTKFPVFQLFSKDREMVEAIQRMVGDEGGEREYETGFMVYLGGDQARVLRAWLEGRGTHD